MAFSLYQPQPAARVHLQRGSSGDVPSSNLDDSCQPVSRFLRLFTTRDTKSAWRGDNTSFSLSQFIPRENLGHVGKLKPARLELELELECWGGNLFFFFYLLNYFLFKELLSSCTLIFIKQIPFIKLYSFYIYSKNTYSLCYGETERETETTFWEVGTFGKEWHHEACLVVGGTPE